MWGSMLQEAYFHSAIVHRCGAGAARFDHCMMAKRIAHFQA